MAMTHAPHWFIRRLVTTVLSILLIALFCAVPLVGDGFGLTARAQSTVDYDDDDDGLIEVDTLARLNAIRWDLNGDGTVDDSANATSYATAFPDAMTGMGCPSEGCTGYELTADLDFSGSTWASGMGWESIGAASASPFTATFDGGAPTYTISDLFINRPSTAAAVGLFGYTAAGSAIRNVKLEGVDVTGVDYVGALVGQNLSEIENIQVAGTVDGRWYVGGLAGLSDGAITASTSSATVTSNSTGGVTGGLVGLSRAAITESHASGAVNGVSWVGGLVGWNQAGINGSSASGTVTATADVSGGLVGLNEGARITNSHAAGAVSGVNYVGGLAGSNDDRIERSTASGRVTGTGNNVGGLAGWSDDIISDSYASGTVTSDGSQVGGLVGTNDQGGWVGGSQADGDVGDASAVNSIGGLAGLNKGTISGSVASGDATGQVHVGGLVGRNEGDIRRTVASGAATGEEQVGGLVGYSDASGTVIDSRAGGTVTSRDGATADGDKAGGLVGWNDGLIGVSYASGAVTGVDSVGGLVGENGGTIKATYASGNVTGSGDGVGGLVGVARKGDSTVPTAASSTTASYARGVVSGSGTNIGGFAGIAQTASEAADNPTFTNNYWDTDTSGQSVGVASDDVDGNGSIDGTETATAGVTGQTTAALQTPTQYDGIYADWRVQIPNAHPYPWLFGGSMDYPALQGPTDPPEFPAGTATRTVAEDFVAGIPIGDPLTATDSDSEVLPLRYKLVGADAVHFSIDEYSGQLRTQTTFDHDHPVDGDRDNTYEFMVQAFDGTVFSFRDVSVTVTDAPDNLQPPTLTGDAAISHPENSTSVATYSANDPENATIIWLAPEGDDARRFAISAGELSFVDPPDFEKPGDGARDNVYQVTVVASDGRLSDRLEVTVTVTDVDEPPVIRGLHEIETKENFAPFNAGWAARDPEEATTTFTWSLSGTDADDFDIDSAASTVTFKNLPDYEAPTDDNGDNVYLVTVQADDGTSSDLGTFDVMITVTGVNEPPDISGPESYEVAENSTAVIGIYSASDPEDEQVGQLQLSGADAGPFELDAGVLRLVEELDYEDPKDVGRGNTYVVTIVATAGSLTGTLDVTVTVTNVNEAPTIRGHDQITRPETSSFGCVARYDASDPEHDETSWTIPSGLDVEDFRINDSGDLCFLTTPDFDAPHDSNLDNVYEVTVGLSDGSLVTTMDVTVTVTPVDEPPTISGESNIEFAENGTETVGTYSASDPEGEPVSELSLSGDDRDDFDLGASGDLTFKTAPDYEAPTDADQDNVYIVIVSADDGDKTGIRYVVVTVTAENEPPLISGDEEADWGENGTGNITGYTATDPEGDSFEWSVSGTDGSLFSIDDGGYLSFNDPPDFEASRGNIYDLTVVATDTEGNPGELQVKVTVTDVNEPPTVHGRDELTVNENDETFSETYTASDPEGVALTFTWSLSGTDGGDFNIDSDTGELTFGSPPDYERPADSNRDNEYLVTVRASDGQYRGTLNVTIAVNDENEAPEFTSSSRSKTSFDFPENRTSPLYTYEANDPERGTITWSVSGDDLGDFDISDTGVLSFAEVPDYEFPVDADQDNEYLVTVEARDDGFNFARLEVTVNVTNASGAEEPTITTTSRPSLTFQETGTGTVDTYRANDPQGGVITWSVAGTDADDFTISSGGELTFASPPDFENPTDGNRDNVYELTVVATDEQGLTDGFVVAVTVTNHAEGVEPTISTRRPPATYRENGTSTVYTFRASDPQGQIITWSLEGADGGDFTVTRNNSGRGELAFSAPPDFEAPADLDRQNDYELTVIATDEDSHADRLSFTITVTDENEPPVVTGTSTFTITGEPGTGRGNLHRERPGGSGSADNALERYWHR